MTTKTLRRAGAAGLVACALVAFAGCEDDMDVRSAPLMGAMTPTPAATAETTNDANIERRLTGENCGCSAKSG